MKRLTFPALMCLLLATGSVAVCLDVGAEEKARPAASEQTLEERIRVLEVRITELQMESSRQAAVIKRQSETILKLEQRPRFSTFPVYTPQNPVPFQNLPLPGGSLQNAQPVLPNHPSTAIPNMPQGTQQHWINGMPFYIVPCTLGVPVTQSSAAPPSTKVAPVFRNAIAGTVVLPDESRPRTARPSSASLPSQDSP